MEHTSPLSLETSSSEPAEKGTPDLKFRRLPLCRHQSDCFSWLLMIPFGPQAAPLMVNVSSFAAASYKKRLYVIGGGPNGKLATDKTQCYDPATNAWSLRAAMPVEAKCINAASFRDHIYVVGE